MNCIGVEESVIACIGSGWKNVNRSICDHGNDAGVYCYKSGQYKDSKEGNNELLYTRIINC